jgi:DNA-binding transcriptional LysR family regulator
VRFIVRTDHFDPLARQLCSGEIDLMIGESLTPPHDTRHSRAQEMVWVHSAATRIDPDRPVPLISYGEDSVHHRLVTTAFKSAGLDWEDVFTSPSFTSLSGAVAAGLGVMPISRLRAKVAGMTVWEDAPLPKLPNLYIGYYIREGGARAVYEQVADAVFSEAEDRVPALLASAIMARKTNSVT